MSTIKKKCKVIMLQSNSRTDVMLIDFGKSKELRHLPTLNAEGLGAKDYKNFEYQHLYILSDEEIKEGDWIYYYENEHIKKVGIIGTNKFNEKSFNDTILNKANKIIATTDSSLVSYEPSINPTIGELSKTLLPQIPKSFVKQYCNKPVNEVLVEYFWLEEIWNHNPKYDELHLKVNSDNTINISSIKDSWSRDELFNIIKKDFTCKNQIAFLNSFIKELK